MDLAGIKVNVRGLVRSGRWAGRYVTIEDDREQTGGYLILFEPDVKGQGGGDIWVKKEDLEPLFAEAAPQVDWLSSSDDDEHDT
jgi:hypothetical protein